MKRLAAEAVFLAVLTLLAQASVTLSSSGSPNAANRPEAAYVPGLGEFMSAAQMRHMKLWFAGSAGNWGLAGYELGEIKEGFADASRLHLVFKGMPISELLEKIVSRPLDGVGRAIEAKDGARFKIAFDGLTAACNECHQAARHGFIVIKRPEVSPFSDQVFKAPR